MHASGITFPSSTLKSVVRRIGDDGSTVENSISKTKKGLLTSEIVQVLQEIIRKRDEINNGVSIKEVIQLVVDLPQFGSRKSAENHLDNLIR